ncbi:MAG: response regulator [Candidatus Omnitrophica bacterium]|nr:response regulator [Candidatus Omnitrophota bacterium]MBU1783829.1 response regulator [Candidatus Omnitrophota bacterium]MBU1850968.1 response regulator [Candidatus Omnitrophota bacterium]
MGIFGKDRPEGIKVVLIDDEKELVAAIKGFLEPRNFLVKCAYDGISGLKIIREENPDIVVLDIMMPEMDGRDVLLELKKDENTKNIPVIMLTARDEQFEIDYGIELGANAYLTKPYRARQLLEQIDNILNL